MRITNNDDKRLSASRLLASLCSNSNDSLPSPANHIWITCADQLSTLTGDNYQIKFFREVVGWFGLAGVPQKV
jgi:hypothetical protein